MPHAGLDDVACPACFTPCTVTRDDSETVSYAVCPVCEYEEDSSGGPIITVQQMLDGVKTGPVYNDVDLANWTRHLARLLRE